MNYQQMYQNSLANRRAKKQTQTSAKVTLADLGKVTQGQPRESAFRHFSNMLQSYRETANAGLHKRVKRFALQWNFELPEWFYR